MNLEDEIRQVKVALNQLVHVVEQMTRKDVELRRAGKADSKAVVPLKLEPQVIVQDKRVWVRSSDICRSKRNPNSLLPISHSTWFKGVASGKFPAPMKLGRSSLWRLTDIIDLVSDSN